MVKKYLMGLDLGTNSVGWCVTDENNRIIKKGGKSLWGARLFEGAQDASGRRSARASRRRTQRRAQRIDLLQLLFKEEIDKVDPTFFLRLNNSAYLLEDKDVSLRDLDDINKPFYEDKTIYHLRNRLYHSTKKEDIRLIYLAMHHMVKYRGNFLYEGQTFKAKDTSKLKEYFEALNQALSSNESQELNLPADFEDKYNKTILPLRGVSQRKEQLAVLFQPSDSYSKNVVLPLIAGGTVTSIKILELDSDAEKPDPEKLCFADGDFDQKFEEFKKAYCDDPATQVVEICKIIYDYTILGKIIGNNETISEAMIARYDQHAKDLAMLKKFVKQWDEEALKPEDKLYSKIFRKKLTNNYVAYIGHSESSVGKIDCAHCDQKDFYTFLKKCFGIDKVKKPEEIQDETLRSIFLKMLDGDFLPKLNSTDNGVFPYQLNLMEMKKILETQSQFYPFLLKRNEVAKEKDGKEAKESLVDGGSTTTMVKIESLLTFRIPYYVGPLIQNNNDGDIRGSHSWVIRHDNVKAIYPWNFSQMVDEDKSAEAFIARMLNHCTYLPDKYCLPASSMMYQKYMVLSYLNKIKINGQIISYEQKEKLINDIFRKHATVKKEQIQSFFEKASLTTAGKDVELEDNVPSLSTQYFFESVFGKEYVEKNYDMLEEIVKDMTILDEGSIKERRLINKYHFDPNTQKDIIKRIKNKKFTGWGRLSKELLTLKTKVNNPTGDGKDDKTLLKLMEETNYNLMELINNDQYDFKKQIEEANEIKEDISDKKIQHEHMLEFVNNEYVSPGMKRSIIQAMAIIDDVEKILGKKIDEYYIECTRTSKAEKKRTASRKEQLLKLYEQAKELTIADIKDRSNDIKNEKDLGAFRSDKYYLYCLQTGKSVYTGKPISLADLKSSNIYDIDHIIPQALVKDDSIENKVLVEKEVNAAKSNHLPSAIGCITKEGYELIERLHKNGLMSERKYQNLMRKTDFTEEEKENFVARQLVYTNQSVKGLADTIRRFKSNNKGGDPDIIFSKAENVSDFRRDYDIVKARDANHYHHAHDAYLNIWVGRAIDTYFTKRRKERGSSYKISNAFKTNLKDLSGNDVWKGQASISEIKKNIFNRFDIMVTRMQYIQHGQLWNATIASKGKAKIPLKLNSPLENMNKYGGRTGVTYAFYAYVEYKNKGKLKRNLFAIPLAKSNGTDSSKTTSYLVNELGLSVTRLLVPCVRVNSVLCFGKMKAAITGTDHQDKSFYLQNLTEINFGENDLKTIKKISKLLSLFKEYGFPIASKEEKDLAKIEKNFSFDEEKIIISPAANERTKAIVLKKEELSQLLITLLDKGSSPFLMGFSGVSIIRQKFGERTIKELYDSLPMWQKAYVLREITMLFGGQSASADLSILLTPKDSKDKVGASIGKSTIPASLPGVTGIYVESPTGFYRKNLLKD